MSRTGRRRRSPWQFSLSALFGLTAIVGFLLFLADLDMAALITVVVTSPASLIVLWCFKDVRRDFTRRHSTARDRGPLDPSITIAPPPPEDLQCRKPRRRKRTRTSNDWWHPFGGYSKQ
jgi:hypothetical protein